jgi:hypothetical protein
MAKIIRKINQLNNLIKTFTLRSSIGIIEQVCKHSFCQYSYPFTQGINTSLH